MKKAIIIMIGIVFIFSFLIVIRNLKAQTKDDISVEEGTKRALVIVGKLLNEQNISTYGLKNINQIVSYRPAKAIILNMITHESIKGYKVGDNFKSKIIKLNDKRIIPLLNENGQNSDLSIELEKGNGKWEFSSFGNNILSNSFNEKIVNGSNEILPIWIPALKVEAIGYDDNQGNILFEIISCPNDEKISSFKGVKISGNDFFNLLKPLADAYNGLPW